MVGLHRRVLVVPCETLMLGAIFVENMMYTCVYVCIGERMNTQSLVCKQSYIATANQTAEPRPACMPRADSNIDTSS